jgi:hypothetical protein
VEFTSVSLPNAGRNAAPEGVTLEPPRPAILAAVP